MSQRTDYRKLIGKVVEYELCATRHRRKRGPDTGRYVGKIVGVAAGPRCGLKHVMVADATYNGSGRFGWKSGKRKVYADELTGVLWFSRFRPIGQWLSRVASLGEN